MDTTTNQQNQTIQENTIVEFPNHNGNGGTAVSPSPQQTGALPTVPPVIAPPQTQPMQGSTVQKEREPTPSLTGKPESIQETEHIVELAPEVKSAGVEAVNTAPQLTIEEKKIGAELAKESALEEKKLEPELKAPLTKGQAEKIAKGWLLRKDTSNPMLWLALLILRQFQILTRQKKN